MLRQNGEEMLREFTERSFQETVTKIGGHIWHVLGMGHSNAIFIEGETGVILIDALDTVERAQKLRALIEEKTGKQVKTIIYTHGHPDHRGGAGAFADLKPEVIAFVPAVPMLAKTDRIQNILMLRSARQFGYRLSDEENVSQGIGIREGSIYGEHHGMVPPTVLYREEQVERCIDGVKLQLVRLPGETDDQIAVWLPEEKVLCCGDNYYGCFPNLYALRGSQYRDVAGWVESLGKLLSYPAEALLPGHTAPILGYEEIQRVLGGYRDCIAWILDRTLDGMNAGKDMDTLASEIRLPEEYAELPFMQEHYGCVEWTVRSIFTGYVGWFDGNPTRLHPLSPKDRAEKTIALMGGVKNALKAAEQAYEDGEYQWCMELCDLCISVDAKENSVDNRGPEMQQGEETCSPEKSGITKTAKLCKAKAMRRLAGMETSANGRHYYLMCAKELEE